MTQTVQNKFNNHSGPGARGGGDLNPGGRGKFNEAQTEERLRVHAIAIATGSPSMKQIVERWHEIGIDITLQSEKEWRQSNRVRIEKRKSDLIESGDLQIPIVSEEVLSDSMMTMTLESSRLSRQLRTKALKLLNDLSLDGGEDEEGRKKNREKLKILEILLTQYNATNKSIKDQLDALFSFSSKIKIKDHRIQKLVDKKFNDKFAKIQESDETIIDDGEITDSVRDKLLGADEEKAD